MLRQFCREEALANALRSIPGLAVEVVDPASLSFSDQMRMAMNAEILIGAHGAGLAHTFAMAEHGALVEIVASPAASTYRLYPNIAGWTGRLFQRIEAPETFGLRGSWLDPDIDRVRECIRDLAQQVEARRPRLSP